MTILPDDTGSADTKCNPGEKATGGGYAWKNRSPGDENTVSTSVSILDNGGWSIIGKYSGIHTSNSLTAFVECSSLE